MKKKTTKAVKKVATKLATRLVLLEQSIKNFKKDNSDWKNLDSNDLYGVESYIDGLLYEKKYKHLAPGYGDSRTDEVVLERLTFDAIHMMTGRRNSCDIYYDDAFQGYDDIGEMNKRGR